MNYIKEGNNIFLKDNDKVVASISFEEINDDTYNINHTFVDESLRGKGIASILVEKAVEEIKSRNKKVVASCSYAKKWLEKRSDYK